MIYLSEMHIREKIHLFILMKTVTNEKIKINSILHEDKCSLFSTF